MLQGFHGQASSRKSRWPRAFAQHGLAHDFEMVPGSLLTGAPSQLDGPAWPWRIQVQPAITAFARSQHRSWPRPFARIQERISQTTELSPEEPAGDIELAGKVLAPKCPPSHLLSEIGARCKLASELAAVIRACAIENTPLLSTDQPPTGAMQRRWRTAACLSDLHPVAGRGDPNQESRPDPAISWSRRFC